MSTGSRTLDPGVEPGQAVAWHLHLGAPRSRVDHERARSAELLRNSSAATRIESSASQCRSYAPDASSGINLDAGKLRTTPHHLGTGHRHERLRPLRSGHPVSYYVFRLEGRFREG